MPSTIDDEVAAVQPGDTVSTLELDLGPLADGSLSIQLNVSGALRTLPMLRKDGRRVDLDSAQGGDQVGETPEGPPVRCPGGGRGRLTRSRLRVACATVGP